MLIARVRTLISEDHDDEEVELKLSAITTQAAALLNGPWVIASCYATAHHCCRAGSTARAALLCSAAMCVAAVTRSIECDDDSPLLCCSASSTALHCICEETFLLHHKLYVDHHHSNVITCSLTLAILSVERISGLAISPTYITRTNMMVELTLLAITTCR